MKEFLSYPKPYKGDAVLAVFCIEAETVFELIIPLVMASIVDVGVAAGDRHYILMKGLQMILFALTSLVLGQGFAMFSARCSQGLGAEIRKAGFTELQRFSSASTDHFSSSSLVTHLTSGVTTMQNPVATGMRPALRSPVMMLTAMTASFYINPRLALVLLAAALILGVLLFFIISHVCPLYSVMQGVIDVVNHIIQENLIAIRVVKSYVRGDYEIQEFEEVDYNLRLTAEKAPRLVALNMPAMQLVMYSAILCILWLGGRLVTIGDVKVDELTSLLSYVTQVLNSLMMFSNAFLMTAKALASWKRISQAMDEETDTREDASNILEVRHGDIRFGNMYPRYNQEAVEYVFSDISSYTKPGQTVSIVGQTDAAKGILVQPILRLYNTTEGTVYIDGRLVQEYSFKGLRDSIAMVSQKNILFSGTIRDNSRWGRETATEQEIEEACRITCMDEFINHLERGYETELGQGGINVSGGQKQRLCIARTILKSPRVLILDDSISAVDMAVEAKIRNGLAKSMPDTTKIIIAQCISSVVHTDQIIILEDGRVNTVGSHEILLASSQIHQNVYHSQQEETSL